MTLEEMQALPEDKQEELFHRLTEERQKAKMVSYSAVYGIGAPKLARELQTSEKEAKKLLEAYWEVNWSVKKVAGEQYVKTLKDGSTWLRNPISGFYHPLRYEKDRWSTTNQSTGDYVFNIWVMYLIKAGYMPSLTYHDEVLLQLPQDVDQEQVEKDLKGAMDKVNEVLNFNVRVSVECKFGGNYAEVH